MNSELEETFLEACMFNILPVAKECIDLGVDVNCVHGETKQFPLMQVALINCTEICDLLLAHPNIDVNKKREDNHTTALMASCVADNPDITRRLVHARGVDLNATDDAMLA